MLCRLSYASTACMAGGPGIFKFRSDAFRVFPEQARRESNPQPPVLETGALPIELLTYTSQGGQGGNRTPDTTIFSRVLYQLSYLAPAPAPPTKSRPAQAAGGRA